MQGVFCVFSPMEGIFKQFGKFGAFDVIKRREVKEEMGGEFLRKWMKNTY